MSIRLANQSFLPIKIGYGSSPYSWTSRFDSCLSYLCNYAQKGMYNVYITLSCGYTPQGGAMVKCERCMVDLRVDERCRECSNPEAFRRNAESFWNVVVLATPTPTPTPTPTQTAIPTPTATTDLEDFIF